VDDLKHSLLALTASGAASSCCRYTRAHFRPFQPPLQPLQPCPQGQQSADIELTSGKHTLSLQFANALHESFGPSERKEITITVQ